MTALYLHWPFCRKKCPYCDFNSHVRESVDAKSWLDALCWEMQYMAGIAKVERITSIFFGGGTPSLMPPFVVEGLIEQAYTLWPVDSHVEITLEANPTSSEAKHFEAYKQAGVNRLSLGVQSLEDKELAFLGREHSATEALHVLEMVGRLFERYSFDLIYARPQQTVAAWKKELAQALHYHHGHLSLYQLTIEPDTAFARVYAKGGFTLPEEAVAAELYETTLEICASYGLERYEVSNYAMAGQESRHNLSYWRGEDYIGVGPGAHGRILRQADGEWVATSTLKSPERWLANAEEKGHGMELCEVVPARERAEEILLGGLRLREGITYEKVEAIINPQKLSLLTQMNLVELFGQQLKVTGRGELLVERIITELITPA